MKTTHLIASTLALFTTTALTTSFVPSAVAQMRERVAIAHSPNAMGGGTIIAQAQLTPLRTFTLLTTANSDGFFSVPHGLPAAKIQGINVAIQRNNLNWHILEASNLVDNRFWWNNSDVQGIIRDPNYAGRPVKIILFVRR